jgi:chromatin remodeling complex protein RSC6
MSKTPAKAAKKADPAPEPAAAAKPAAKAKAAPKAEAAPAAAAAKAKTVEKPKDGAKPNALQQPLQPSAELAAIVGSAKLARGEVVSKVWVYIKEHKLQNPADGREILADAKLQKVFGKPKVTMFEMNKHLAAHLK